MAPIKTLAGLCCAVLAVGCSGGPGQQSAGGGSATAGGVGGTAGGSAGGGSAGGAAGGAAGGSTAGSIAARHPRDVGIESDPDVLWAEPFDQASVAQLAARYTNAQSTSSMSLVMDAAPGAAGATSLRVTAAPGNSGGSLYRYLGAGYDEVFLRYYIKYTDSSYHHTTVNLGGINPAVRPYVMQGPSGLCCTAPDGDKAISVSAEVYAKSGATFPFDFYNYWFEMKAWGDVVMPPVGATEPDPITMQLKVPAAGNAFLVGSQPRITPGRWYAIELHVKLNTPPNRDGLLGMWVDGQRIQEFGQGFPNGTYQGTDFRPDAASAQTFPGLRWRSSTALNLNYLWITHYADQVPQGATSVVFYDQLVLARSYVGPIVP